MSSWFKSNFWVWLLTTIPVILAAGRRGGIASPLCFSQ
jgi:hypothetical protein